MSLEKELEQRSSSKCELCSSIEKLSAYTLPDIKENGLKTALYACSICMTP
jgi:protein PhnA